MVVWRFVWKIFFKKKIELEEAKLELEKKELELTILNIELEQLKFNKLIKK